MPPIDFSVAVTADEYLASVAPRDEGQALIDAYYRHLYHPDPAAQLSAAGYLGQIEAAGVELPEYTRETFPDITLGDTEYVIEAAGKPAGLALSPRDPAWTPAPVSDVGDVAAAGLGGSGGGAIGAMIGIVGLLFGAALLFGKKK